MKLPHCPRCNQPKATDALHRGICDTCRAHSCTKHDRGTPACYMVCGCRCGRCGRAHTKREQYRKMRTAQGHPALIPAIGVHRRIHALMALGWTAQHIADAAGLGSSRAVHQYLHHDQVRVATAAKIRRAYRLLAMRLGPSAVTKSRAATAGYPPPLAWDDDGPHGIDNPAATPIGAGWQKPRNVSANVIELATNGEVLAAIQTRLQLTRSGVYRALKDTKRLDLWPKIMREAA